MRAADLRQGVAWRLPESELGRDGRDNAGNGRVQEFMNAYRDGRTPDRGERTTDIARGKEARQNANEGVRGIPGQVSRSTLASYQPVIHSGNVRR